MLEILKKGRSLKYVEVYFAETADYTVKQKCDICTYRNIYTLHDERNNHFSEYTLISDLSQSEDELWKQINKNTRYEIRRAERYELEFITYDSKQIKNEDGFSFDKFSDMYEKMFAEKGMPRKFDREEFYNIVKFGGGIITAVLFNSEPIVYHFYIYDETHTKLTISCSELWSEDGSIEKNLIGYANKWLHWKDFLYFKEIGVESYDWGGVTWNEENPGKLAGINKFKQSFGGKPVSYYSETVVMSGKAKLFKRLSKLKSRIKK